MLNVEQAFPGAKRSGAGWMVKCPAHADSKASLKLDAGEDGRLLVKCFAGCSAEAIVQAAGLEMRDLMAERTEARKIVATYDYQTPDGALVHQVVRYQPKDFRPRRPDGRGGWIWNLKGVSPLLFNLPKIQGQRTVIVVEGEKDVLSLGSIGVLGTTNAGGASKWRDAHTSQLAEAGVREVVVIADADAPGREHARRVAASCQQRGIASKIIELPAAKDAAAWIDGGGTKAALFDLIKAAPLADASSQPVPTDAPVIGGTRGIFWFEAGSIKVSIERVREKGLDMHGECVATVNGDERARFSVNLLSTRTRAGDVRHLRERIGDDIPWDTWLDLLYRRVITDTRAGDPPVEVANLEEPESYDEPVYVVRGLPLLRDHQTTISAPQGSAKTWIMHAAAIDLANQGVPVAILDYELNESATNRRLWLLAGGRPPLNIYYFPMTRPLVRDEDRLCRMFAEREIRYCFIDSQGPAIDGPLKDEEGATEFRNALSRLKVGALVLAHVPKSIAENPQAPAPAGPIGSVLLGNLSRLNYFARREPGAGPIKIGLVTTKNTFGKDGADAPVVGIQVRFDREYDEVAGEWRTRAAHVEPLDAAELSLSRDDGPVAAAVWRRMQQVLAASPAPMRPVELARMVGASVDTVQREARNRRDVFAVDPGKRGQQGTIALLSRHAAETNDE